MVPINLRDGSHSSRPGTHTHNISTSTITITRLHSVYSKVRLPQTEIFQQLLNWFPWNFVKIFKVPRGWSLLTLVILQKLKYSRVMYRVRYTPALAAAKQKRMKIKMEGYGETHTSTPNTTDRVREISRVLDLPSLKRNTHVYWINQSDTSVHLSTLSRGTTTTYWQIK